MSGSPEFELYYWKGNFAGRGEFIRMMLSVCGVSWQDTAQVRAEESIEGQVNAAQAASKCVLEYVRGEAGGYPVLFPPILKHGDKVLNQTPAMLLYLGQLYNMSPTEPIELAHALQITMTALDALSGAEQAYHPVSKNGSYESQVKEAETTISEFLENRLPRFASVLERQISANDKKSGFFVGESMTFADIAVFQLIRGWRSSQPENWKTKSKELYPLLASFAEKMESDKRISAFLNSSQSTKMEDPRNTPLAKEPLVQVNSFM